MNAKYLSKIVKKIKATKELGGKCKICNENNIFKLTFHHKDPKIKEDRLSNMFQLRYSVIKNELKKCELLCHNCHSELHFNENTNNNTGSKRSRNNKQVLLKFISKKCCSECGYNKCMAAIDFHHIKDKLFNIGDISTILTIQDLDEKIISEINKCVLICKNCHYIKNSNYDWVMKNITMIMNQVDNYKEKQSKIDRNEVKKMLLNGSSQSQIAKSFNASKGTICDIVKKIKMEANRLDEESILKIDRS